LTEYLPGAEPNLPGGGDDLVAWDVFESITRPGALLHLRSWRNVAAAEAVAPGGDVHRVVRIIRDYGMYSREEAPQHFPPVARSDEAGPSARATPAAGHSRNAQFAAPDGSAST
jgi:hypothetical protein